MKIKILLFIYLFSSCALLSQNLVINGGFEDDSTTQWGFYNMTGWFQLNSADMFHMNVPGPFISIDQKLPRSGEGFVGLYVGGYGISPQNDSFPSHEYIIGELATALEPDQNYHVSFWAKPSGAIFDPEFIYTTDRIGACFIMDTSELRLNRIGLELILDEDIINTNGVLINFQDYVKISTCYKAKGGEQFIVIGNLAQERENTIFPLSDNSMYEKAYFIVDDVEVIREKELNTPLDTIICKGDGFQIEFDTSFFYPITINSVPIEDHFEILDPGVYTIRTRFGDCPIQKSIQVQNEKCYQCNFFVPNTFSPNSDGVNDEVFLSSNCSYQIIESGVFDRWGNQLYFSEEEFNWDGSNTLGNLDVGTYIYFIKLLVQTPINEQYKLIKGGITLVK